MGCSSMICSRECADRSIGTGEIWYRMGDEPSSAAMLLSVDGIRKDVGLAMAAELDFLMIARLNGGSRNRAVRVQPRTVDILDIAWCAPNAPSTRVSRCRRLRSRRSRCTEAGRGHLRPASRNTRATGYHRNGQSYWRAHKEWERARAPASKDRRELPPENALRPLSALSPAPKSVHRAPRSTGDQPALFRQEMRCRNKPDRRRKP